MGVRADHRGGKCGAVAQRHQSAAVEPGRAQLVAHQRDAHAGGGGVAHQTDVVELRAFGRLGPIEVHGGKPGAPGLQRAAQQRLVVDALRGLKRAVLAQELRRCHGGDHIVGDAYMFQVGVSASAKAHHQIGVFGDHVEQRDRDLHGDVDLGIGLGEFTQTRNHHRARKRGGDRQTQFALARRSTDVGELLQNRQPLTHIGQVFAAFGGERKIRAAEQLGANDLLQLARPVAHRAGGDAQFFRGLRDAAQTRQRLKGQQALNGGNAGNTHRAAFQTPLTIIRVPQSRLTARLSRPAFRAETTPLLELPCLIVWPSCPSTLCPKKP